MNFSQLLPFFLALAAGHFFLPLLVLLVRSTLVEVEDEHAVLITSFGRLTETLRTPGAHFRPSRLLPWVKTTSVSLARDFRVFTNVHVNDTRGTTVLVDLWVELRVVDPVRALFAVDDWDHSVQNLVTYAATSILGGRDFQAILHDRNALGEALLREIRGETERWGISVDRAFIRNVSLLPEVARLLFGTIAARIERAKATVEEQGQIEVARLEADTARQCAGFVAEAKAQYPLPSAAASPLSKPTPPSTTPTGASSRWPSSTPPAPSRSLASTRTRSAPSTPPCSPPRPRPCRPPSAPAELN